MTVLWEPDRQAVESIEMALGAQTRVVDGAPTASRTVLSDPLANLLVVGPDIDLTSALGVAEEIRLERPEAGVVLMRRRLDVALLSQAAKAGVREVVGADDLAALTDACRRSQELSARLGAATGEVAEGRVVTVFSAKGGCGKTTVSVNVAAELARSGTRTLLVDLDLAFGDDAITLGLAPERSIADLVPMAGHLDGEGLASVVTRHDTGLDVLCAPKHPGDADTISGTLVSEVLRIAKRGYEVVVVDTPPAFSEHVLAAFDTSDRALILATLDIPSVKNLRLALDTLDLLGQPRDLRTIALNRADAKTGLSVEDTAAAIHHEIDVQIPDSKDVTSATNRGTPIVLAHPKHPVSVALRGLAHADVLAGRPAQPAPGGQPKPGRPSRSPFRRHPVEAGAEA
ncbi:MAG: AAA family ATPase [Marmoricola sp.]